MPPSAPLRQPLLRLEAALGALGAWPGRLLWPLLALGLLLGIALSGPVASAQTSLPEGKERSVYRATLPVEGSDFVRVGGTVPFGLQLTPEGILEGVPSYPRAYTFTARYQTPSGVERQSFRVEIVPWQRIGTLECGGVQSFTLSASARQDALRYDLDAPGAAAFFSLPISEDVGAVTLTLSGEGAADGALLLPRTSFGPGAAEIYAYTLIEDHPGPEALRLSDGTPGYGLANYRGDGRVPITVAATLPGTFTLTTECSFGAGGGPDFLPNGTLGRPYAGQLTAFLGVAPLGFLATGLPEGLSLDPLTGEIGGIPTEAGAFVVGLGLEDGAGHVDGWEATLIIAEGVPLGCGESIEGAFVTAAFPGEQGLRTPGGVAFIDLVPALDTSAMTAHLTGADQTGYAPALFLGRPWAQTGAGTFDAYADYAFDHGEGVSMAIDTEGAPMIGAYGGIVPVAVAAAGGAGGYALSLTCSADLRVLPFLAHPPIGAPYTAQLEALGEGAGDALWAVVGGALPEGLSLDGDTGLLSGEATGAGGGEVVFEATSGEGVATRAFTLTPGVAACGDAIPLSCGDFTLGTLTAPAWGDRVHLDLSVPGGVDFYCLMPSPGASAVEVILSPVSGSNADLLAGAEGLPPGSQALGFYVDASTEDGEDRLVLTAERYPLWGAAAPVALAVPAFETGSYTLEVLCD